MKRGFYILLIMCTAVLVVSCDKTKSYVKMLKEQQKAIDALERDSGLVFLSEFPKDSIFKENEFVELEDGVYLNIIDKGNSDRAVLYSTDIQVRFKATMFMQSSSLGTGSVDLIGPHSNGTHPVEFKYGSYGAGLYDYAYNIFICPGLAAALPYVGDSSSVKLIVPFKHMGTIGDFQSTGTPVYFEKVRYIFNK